MSNKLIRDPSAPAPAEAAGRAPSPASPEAAEQDHRSGMQRLAQEWKANRKPGTQIGPSFVIEGEIRGESDLEVDGTVTGRIELPANQVVIGPHAQVRADVLAARIVVNGPIEGALTARERIELQAAARVTGSVTAPSVVVQEGAVLDGRIDMKPAPGAREGAGFPPPPPRTGPVRVRPPSAPAGTGSTG